MRAGEGGEPARLVGDGAVGGGEVQAGEGDGEDGEVLLDGDVRCPTGTVIAQSRQVRAVLDAEGGRLGEEVDRDPLQVLLRGQVQLSEDAVVLRQGLTGAGPVGGQDPGPDDVAQVVQGGIDQQRGLGGVADLDGEVGVEGAVLGSRRAGGEAGCSIDQCPGGLGRGESLPGRCGEHVSQCPHGGQGRLDTRIGAPFRRGSLRPRRDGVRQRWPAGGRREVNRSEPADRHCVDRCGGLSSRGSLGHSPGLRADRRRRRGLIDCHLSLLTPRRPGTPHPETGLSVPGCDLVFPRNRLGRFSAWTRGARDSRRDAVSII